MTTMLLDGSGDLAWVLCSRCKAIVYGKRWERLLHVCPECGQHDQLGAYARLVSLADSGTLDVIELPADDSPDPLEFVDTMPYVERLSRTRAATRRHAAVLSATMTIEGTSAVVAAMDFGFLGGSLGTLAGEVLVRAADLAIATRRPLVVVTASGGARMQEGALSLMQMARTSAAWARMDDAGLLTVSVITDPTYGGVAASFATLSDVLIAERGARLGFAGRRVIEQTIAEQLPADFQSAEFLLARGFVDSVVPRDRVKGELGRILRVGNPARARVRTTGRGGAVVRDPGLLREPDPWTEVQRARDVARPTALDYFQTAFDEFIELRGDRLGGDCAAMVAGFARLGDGWVVGVGSQKGHTAKQLKERNFGMPSPAGYRKAARVMRLAAKLGLPVVALIDTPGAFPGADAEVQGQAWAIAENLRLMSSLRVPIVAVITGEGGSGGALGIALANRVLMWEHAVYSVISPEGCASILWKDASRAPDAAAALRLSSRDLLRLGVVDAVLPEPPGGVAADPDAAATQLRAVVSASLDELHLMTGAELVRDRERRFSRFGHDTIAVVADRLAVANQVAS